MLDLFNTAASAALALGAGWAVMSPQVRCGLLMHLGLALVAVGFLGVFLIALGPYAYASAVAAANGCVHSGLVLLGVGYLRRSRRRGPRRRASDWMELPR